jgi:hypothetical protein
MAFTLAQLEHLFCWTGGDGGDDADMLSIGGLCLSGMSAKSRQKAFTAATKKLKPVRLWKHLSQFCGLSTVWKAVKAYFMLFSS